MMGFAASVPEALKVEIVKHADGVDWGGAAPWLIAAAALGFSIYQFFTQTKIKRLEYLDGLAKTMRDEPLLGIATQMLDWEVRTIEFEEKRYVYSVTMLQAALAVHTAPVPSPEISEIWKKGFNEIETLIRDAFDSLFGFLENVQYAVDLGVLTEENVYAAPFAYYLTKLCEKDQWTNCGICRYLKGYGFPKTERLLTNYRARFSPTLMPFGAGEIEACNKAFEAEVKDEVARKLERATGSASNLP